jgi:Kinesin motor domain
VQVSMSYYEIYNDKVFDLFEAPEKRTLAGLPLRDAGGKTIVAGLTERPCETLKDFERLYDLANANRSTGATKVSLSSAGVPYG